MHVQNGESELQTGHGKEVQSENYYLLGGD